MARKLAVLFYTLLKNHQEYDRDRYNQMQQKREKGEMRRLKRLVHKLEYEIQKKELIFSLNSFFLFLFVPAE
jgi:hypothetical protein